MSETLTPFYLWILALGLFVGGTPVLISAMYLVVSGTLNVGTLAMMTLATTLLWDTIWYSAGRLLSGEHPECFPLSGWRRPTTEKLERFYLENRYGLVFGSRFIYGTNSVLSVLSGAFRMPYARFVTICVLSITSWFALLYLLSTNVAMGLSTFSYLYGAEVLIPVFLFLTIGITIVARRTLRRLLLE